MAELVPLKAVYNGSNVCGLSELRDGDVVGVEHGGLGVCTLAANSLLIGNTQGSVTTTSALTNNGQIIIGGTSGPTVANLSGTSNEVDITNGDGTIQIGLPAAITVTTSIKSPAICVSSQYALPAADGSAGQIMCTDGSGALSFVAFDGSGHCISFGGSTVADRTCLNFLGGGVTVSDNSGTNATDITIPVTTPELKVRNVSGTELGIQLDNTAIGGELICDTTPQLGGTLDVNGFAISSASDGNIAITPHGDGAVVLDGLSWPIADGTAGYILCTNGSGTLAWAADASGQSVAGSNTQLQFNNSGAFGASSNLTWDDTTLAIGNSSAADYLALRLYQGGGTTYYWDFTADVDAGDLIIGGNHSSFDLILNPSYGNVGIGTTAPDVQLHLEQGTDTTTGTLPSARFERTGASQTGVVLRSNGIDGLILRADSAGFGAIHSYEDLGFYTGATPGSSYGTVRMRIDSATGNIGIGTATPANLLHVYGSGNIAKLQGSSGTEASMAFTPASGNGWQLGAGPLTANSFQLYENTAAAARITVLEGGKVGIGTTSPDHNFEVEAAGNTLNTFMGNFKTTVGTYNLQVEGTHGGVTGTAWVSYQNSSSPADGDFAGAVGVEYKDDGGNRVQVGSSGWFVTDVSAGSRDSYFYLRVYNNNSAVAGTLSSSGVWTDSSAAAQKEYYGTRQEVWPDGVLGSLKTLNVSKYKPANQPEDKPVTETHVSPTAEDFWDAFQIGQDPRREMLNAEGEQILNPSIAPKDLSGVALVAVQELLERVEAAEAKVEAAEAKIAVLESA